MIDFIIIITNYSFYDLGAVKNCLIIKKFDIGKRNLLYIIERVCFRIAQDINKIKIIRYFFNLTAVRICI